MALSRLLAQNRVTGWLRRGMASGRVPQALLLTGPDLEALVEVAMELAKALNCPIQGAARGLGEAGADSLPDGCDACESCRRIAEGIHPDVRWVRPENKSRQISIDQIRDLSQSLFLKATEAAYKVGVLVAADRMSEASSNAFLKTLEEPPRGCVLILLSCEPQRLLDTVISRCLRLTLDIPEGGAGFRDPSGVDWVGQFATRTRATAGGLLPRYQLLGAFLASLVTLREEVEADCTAASPLHRHGDVEGDLREKWESELKGTIEAEYRLRRGRRLSLLEWWLRDVWLCTLGSGSPGTPAPLMFPDWTETTQAVAKALTPEQSGRNIETVERLIRMLHTNVQESLAIEVAMLQLQF